MHVYFIQKEGIYFHGVHGIFATEKEAVKQCKACAQSDCDSYHEWHVIEVLEGDKPETKHGFSNKIFATRKNELPDI